MSSEGFYSGIIPGYLQKLEEEGEKMKFSLEKYR